MTTIRDALIDVHLTDAQRVGMADCTDTINRALAESIPAPMRGPDDPSPSAAALRTYRTVWHVEYCPKSGGDYCYVTTCRTHEDAELFVEALRDDYRNFHITGPHQHDVTE